MPPSRVAFSQHALEQLARRGLSAARVSDVLLAHHDHDRRTRNPRSADWVDRPGGVAVAYDWPDEDDDTTAYVMTVWRE
jgi:hypothetical protein